MFTENGTVLFRIKPNEHILWQLKMWENFWAIKYDYKGHDLLIIVNKASTKYWTENYASY